MMKNYVPGLLCHHENFRELLILRHTSVLVCLLSPQLSVDHLLDFRWDILVGLLHQFNDSHRFVDVLTGTGDEGERLALCAQVWSKIQLFVCCFLPDLATNSIFFCLLFVKDH